MNWNKEHFRLKWISKPHSVGYCHYCDSKINEGDIWEHDPENHILKCRDCGGGCHARPKEV